jgi:uroporphyrinogen-III synthase
VKNFVALLGLRGARAALKKTSANHGVHSASIGPVTSATLREFGLPVDIEAKEFDIPGLLAAIVEMKHRIKSGPSRAKETVSQPG